MNASELQNWLKKAYPSAKITTRKNDIFCNFPLNSVVELEIWLAHSFSYNENFQCKSQIAISCKRIEILVQAIRLNMKFSGIHNLRTLYYYPELGALNLDVKENWLDWTEKHELMITEIIQSHTSESLSPLEIIFNELRPDEIHLENIPIAGHYQYRMLASIVTAMLIRRDSVLPLIAAWRKVVEADFDFAFLDRATFMFEHYSVQDLESRQMEIFYEMSERFGNPFLKQANKKLNLLKEASITVEGKYLQVIFNSMPPEGGIEDEYWDSLHKVMAKELEIDVTRDDREVFLLHDKSSVTKTKLKAWLKSFWDNHPDAPQ